MKRLRKAAALALSIILVLGLLPASVVHAAYTPVAVSVESYSSGTVNIKWPSVSGTSTVRVTYHTPNADDTVNTVVLNSTAAGATFSVPNLESDYIYDIDLRLFSTSGTEIGSGLLYYCPGITFYSKSVDTGYEDLTGGGRQSGHIPELNLRWMEPKIYNGAANFERMTAFDSMGMMETMINNRYGALNGNIDLASMNYRINLATDEAKLNGNPDEAALIIQYDSGSGDYLAHVSTNTTSPYTAEVTQDIYGYYSFDLRGRADTATTIDTTGLAANILPDDDILPGTVYYMNVKPMILNAAGTQQSVVTVGNPDDQNGTVLSGAVSYAYTPLRFQLTKDSINNIYVKVYRINQGSLDLPRLYYEIQAGDDPSKTGDWTVMYTLDDSYFVGETTTVPIDGGNPNNTVYYKIVVKSDNNTDRLESLKMPYMLSIDSSRPPVLTGISVTGRTLHSSGVMTLPHPADPANTTISFKSTDITVTWDKPEVWNTSKAALAVSFLVSTNQSDLAADSPVPLYINGTYWDEYPVKYRLVKYVAGASTNIIDNGTTLSYTIDALSLFQGEAADGSAIDFNTDAYPGNDNPEAGATNTTPYPTFFLPNTVYYLQMYTTLIGDAGTVNTEDMSDRSIITTFTTLTGAEQEVPLPMNFGLEGNGTYLPTDAASVTAYRNYIDLKFDKIDNLDWTNYTSNYDLTKYKYDMYYDIYMNTRSDTDFTLVGTTEFKNEDVLFTGIDDVTSTSVIARITSFTNTGNAAQLERYTRFGKCLQSNTTYYFYMKTRLVITDLAGVESTVTMESRSTAILAVTTLELVVNVPDDSTRRPLAPVDFAIATDSSGNQLVSGRSVTFTWQRLEEDVVYELIRTSSRVATTDKASAHSSDDEYRSFLSAYDYISDGVTDGKVYLDPANPPAGFTYDSTTKTCTFVVDKRMFPNKLYYFSLKAVRVIDEDTTSESVWVCIPVTTSLIEAPTSLVAMSDAQLGFFWTDETSGITADDFYIYIKKSSDSSYSLISRSASTVVADSDGSTFYGRLIGLSLDSYYDIKVYRGSDKTTVVYSASGVATRDGAHELEVSWIGLPVDDYSSFELAIRPEDGSDYTTLDASDLEAYTDKNGYSLPYYWEETQATLLTDYVCYHARIKSMPVELTADVTTHQAIKSNVKYYIKVRSEQVDSVDLANVSYSKYAGPVNIRTEFNQSDYDDTDRQEQSKAIFLDKIEEMESSWYWRISGGDSTVKVLIKSTAAVSMVNYAAGTGLTLDISEYSSSNGKDIIYIPLAVVKALNAKSKSLVIRTAGAEYTYKPGSLDAANSQQIKAIDAMTSVADIYLELTINRSVSPSKTLPTARTLASSVNNMDLQAQGTSVTSDALKKLIDDKLYNEDTGLVSENLTILLNTYIGTGTDSYKLLEEYTSTLVGVIEEKLSTYINTTFEAEKLSTAAQDITKFNSPMSAKLNYTKASGAAVPYVLYDGAAAWQKIGSNVVQSSGSLLFNIAGTGEYLILAAAATATDVPVSDWSSVYVSALSSKYDLSDVFSGSGTTFSPNNLVACSEVILLFEKVTGRTNDNYGLTVKQKVGRLGLDGIFSPTGLLKSAKRQQTAAVLMKLMEVKKGLDPGSMKPGVDVYIKDEAGISDVFYTPVLAAVSLKVMSTDGEGNFKPEGTMTRAETVAAFVKLLKLTGDITE